MMIFHLQFETTQTTIITKSCTYHMEGVGVPAEDIVCCRRPLARGHGSGCELVVMMCGGGGLRRLM